MSSAPAQQISYYEQSETKEGNKTVLYEIAGFDMCGEPVFCDWLYVKSLIHAANLAMAIGAVNCAYRISFGPVDEVWRVEMTAKDGADCA